MAIYAENMNKNREVFSLLEKLKSGLESNDYNFSDIWISPPESERGMGMLALVISSEYEISYETRVNLQESIKTLSSGKIKAIIRDYKDLQNVAAVGDFNGECVKDLLDSLISIRDLDYIKQVGGLNEALEMKFQGNWPPSIQQYADFTVVSNLTREQGAESQEDSNKVVENISYASEIVQEQEENPAFLRKNF